MPTTEASRSLAGGVAATVLAALLIAPLAAPAPPIAQLTAPLAHAAGVSAVARPAGPDQLETWASVRIAPIPETPQDQTEQGDDPAEAAAERLDAAGRAVEGILRPHIERELVQLQDRQRESLIKTIARHVAARHLPEPDGALALTRLDEAHRWITPDDGRDWTGRFARWYEARHGSPPDESVPMPDVMREYIEETLSESESRIVGLADEARGVRVWSARGRTPQLAHMALRGELSEDDVDFWMVGRGRPAMMFRTPVRTLEEVTGEQGPATLVRVHLLVRTEADEVVALISDWYWDARAGAWSVMNFGRRGFEPDHGLACWF